MLPQARSRRALATGRVRGYQPLGIHVPGLEPQQVVGDVVAQDPVLPVRLPARSRARRTSTGHRPNTTANVSKEQHQSERD